MKLEMVFTSKNEKKTFTSFLLRIANLVSYHIFMKI